MKRERGLVDDDFVKSQLKSKRAKLEIQFSYFFLKNSLLILELKVTKGENFF